MLIRRRHIRIEIEQTTVRFAETSKVFKGTAASAVSTATAPQMNLPQTSASTQPALPASPKQPKDAQEMPQ